MAICSTLRILRNVFAGLLVASLLMTVIYLLSVMKNKSQTLELALDKIDVGPSVATDKTCIEKEAEKPNEVYKPLQTKFPSSCRCQLSQFLKKKLFDDSLDLVIPGQRISNREHLKKRHPNFPISIADNIPMNRCHLMPSPLSIEWSNTYYQKVNMGSGAPYYLYSAIMDNRPHTALRPCVRILAYSTEEKPPRPWCYFWFNVTGPPVVSRVSSAEIVKDIVNTFGKPRVFVLTCRINTDGPVIKPKAVSVVSKPCQPAENLLEVVGALKRNKTSAYVDGRAPKGSGSKSLQGWNAAVCGPSLHYYQEDFSIRLVEWIEIVRALGFSKIFFHETDIHPNISKVLYHYESQGFVEVTKFKDPEPYQNEPMFRRIWYVTNLEPHLLMEAMHFSDCVLRHMHQYRFIAHIDSDEIPMLLHHDSYLSWMDDELTRAHMRAKGRYKKLPSFYTMEWRYHHGDLEPSEKNWDLPQYLWALRHSFISTNYNMFPMFSKPLYDMDLVTAVSSHKAFLCNTVQCQRQKVPPSTSYLGHFRYTCGERCQVPNSIKEVPVLLKYKESVTKSVWKTIKKLQLI